MVMSHVAAVILGVVIIGITLFSSMRTLVLPRSERDPLTAGLFSVVRHLFMLGGTARSYAERDRLMAFYAPISLLLLPLVWMTLVGIGYMFVYLGVGVPGARASLFISGSALFTLGSTSPIGFFAHMVMYSEAIVGLLLMALLISYLPTMYAAFSKREVQVTLLEYRTGSPPSGTGLIRTLYELDLTQELSSFWKDWETWFVELEETHTSLAPLIFFRSPRPQRSWITATGVVLDAAALVLSVVDAPRDTHAYLCYRAGYTALQRIAEIAHTPGIKGQTDNRPISVARQEFIDAVCQLQQAGVPIRTNMDEAWSQFQQLRGQYDVSLVSLATLTMAPEARWSSDRSILIHRRSRDRNQSPKHQTTKARV